VGLDIPIEKLRHPSPDSQTAEGSLRLSSEMVAALIGAGFNVTSVTPEQQPVAAGFPTAGTWIVEAKQDGDQELEAVVYALFTTAADKVSRQRIASYTQKISVSVRAQTWGEWLTSIGTKLMR
jgi:hypothetical protein